MSHLGPNCIGAIVSVLGGPHFSIALRSSCSRLRECIPPPAKTTLRELLHKAAKENNYRLAEKLRIEYGEEVTFGHLVKIFAKHGHFKSCDMFGSFMVCRDFFIETIVSGCISSGSAHPLLDVAVHRYKLSHLINLRCCIRNIIIYKNIDVLEWCVENGSGIDGYAAQKLGLSDLSLSSRVIDLVKKSTYLCRQSFINNMSLAHSLDSVVAAMHALDCCDEHMYKLIFISAS